MGGLVRLQWYVQSEVSVLSNWGAHFTGFSSENPWRGGFLELQPVKCAPQLLSMDTSDCTYHCNRTSPPVSQSNERKATLREVKKPLATVPPPAIYILSKNSPRSLNIQVELTSLTSLTSVSTSALLDSGASCRNTSLRPLHFPNPSSYTMSTAPQMRTDQSWKKSMSLFASDATLKERISLSQTLDSRW